MPTTNINRYLTFYFRIAMAWTFLYAGLSQVIDPKFSATAFLEHTKTFHDFFAWFASPGIVPYTDFLVEWGHTLIGLSLLAGLMVRVSSVFGVLLMITYYFAHMDFPYIESNVNFIMDYHLVYAGTLVYLIVAHAGHVWGLDGLVEKFKMVERHPALRELVS